MEDKTTFYFCLEKNCFSIFPNTTEHKGHQNFCEKIPSDLTTQYDFQEKLGMGAFGVVFKVFDKSDRKVKAMKIALKQSSAEDAVAEVEVLKELYHHNLLRYFQSGFCKKKFISKKLLNKADSYRFVMYPLDYQIDL